MFVVIDNYDSFTFNLVQQLGERDQEVEVIKNDDTACADIESEVDCGRLKGLVISPGPGRPEQAGVSVDLIHRFSGQVPILGVCLGHQCIAQAAGAEIIESGLMHGKTSEIYHSGERIFTGIPSPLQATRYHSLIVARRSFSPDFKVAAETEKQEIMALFHREYPTFGLQFHPESILTPDGGKIIDNFIRIAEQFFIKGDEPR